MVMRSRELDETSSMEYFYSPDIVLRLNELLLRSRGVRADRGPPGGHLLTRRPPLQMTAVLGKYAPAPRPPARPSTAPPAIQRAHSQLPMIVIQEDKEDLYDDLQEGLQDGRGNDTPSPTPSPTPVDFHLGVSFINSSVFRERVTEHPAEFSRAHARALSLLLDLPDLSACLSAQYPALRLEEPVLVTRAPSPRRPRSGVSPQPPSKPGSPAHGRRLGAMQAKLAAVGQLQRRASKQEKPGSSVRTPRRGQASPLGKGKIPQSARA